MIAYRIPDWKGNKDSNWVGYEPPANTQRTEKGLPWVRIPVKAPSISQAYLDLVAIAPRTEVGLAAFGLFVRCVEMVASRPRNQRDGTILGRDGCPATIAYIARVCQGDEAFVGELLDLLVKADWLTAGEWTVDREATLDTEADCPGLYASSDEGTRSRDLDHAPTTHQPRSSVVGVMHDGDANHNRDSIERPSQKAEAEVEGERETEVEARRDACVAAAVGCATKRAAAAEPKPGADLEQAEIGERILHITGVLTELGIGMPTRRDLAVLWGPVGDAQRRIREIGLEYGNKGKGKGKGILVNELRAAGEAERIRRKRAVSFWLHEMAKREPEAVAAAVNAAIAKLPPALQERAHKLGVRGEAIWPELIAELRRQGWRRVGSFVRTVASEDRLDPVGR